MKEILIPLNFTTTPVLYDTKQSFSASDEESGVLTFTTIADVTGTVASLTIRNASENANRQTVLIERLDVNSSPFSYAVKMPLPFGNYEGEVLLKKNLTVLASAKFLFGVNSSLSAEVLPKLVEAYSLDNLVEEVETEVSNLKDAYNVTVSETVKGVKKTESTLQLSENVRYLNEATRKDNELLRISQEAARVVAEEGRVTEFGNLVDSAVIEQTVTQEVAEKYQEIEATQANRLLSAEQQLAEINITADNAAQKADAMASGSPKGVYATLTLLQSAFPTGATGAYLVTADGNWYYWAGSAWVSGGLYQATGIASRSINPEKTSFVKIGSSNLFDKSTIILDKYVSPDNGNLGTIAGFFTSAFIPIAPSTQYIINVSRYIAIYDTNKVYISGLTVASPYTNVTFNTPTNAGYMRFSNNYSTAIVDANRVNVGASVLAYEPYYLSADSIKPKLMDGQIENKHIADGTITDSKLAFVSPVAITGKNLFDVSKITTGKYVNWTSGNLNTSANYDSSDFIPVKAATTYARKQSAHIAFYDANRVIISGLSASGLTFTTPDNTAYIRVSVASGKGSTEQIEEGSVSSTYERFGYSLPGLLALDAILPITVKINLPSKIYALVGQELNIYFDNIVNVRDTDYDFDVVATVGDQYKDFYRFTPDVAGTFPISVSVLKKNVVLASVSSTIVVKAASVGTGANKKVILIGDSTTNNGYPSIKLNENFSLDPMNITLLGTRGTAPDLHEGRSGWTAKHYVENAKLSGVVNAFWNPTTSRFDFAYYLANSGIATPDYVVINLGINDVFGYLDDSTLNAEIPNVIMRYNEMIASIKSYSASIKIGVALTIPPNYSQDGFARPYDAGQTRARYKRNNFLLVQKLMETYQNREGENIYLVPIHLNIDTRYGYGMETIQINARDTRMMEIAVTNGGVHPGITGYWQIADSYWYFLKSFEV